MSSQTTYEPPILLILAKQFKKRIKKFKQIENKNTGQGKRTNKRQDKQKENKKIIVRKNYKMEKNRTRTRFLVN